MKKVGVSREEQELPYYKYFTRPLAEVPAEKLAVLEKGPSPVRAVPFEQRNLFLKGGGQGILPDRLRRGRGRHSLRLQRDLHAWRHQ